MRIGEGLAEAVARKKAECRRQNAEGRRQKGDILN
jgi:hypothetical protein